MQLRVLILTDDGVCYTLTTQFVTVLQYCHSSDSMSCIYCALALISYSPFPPHVIRFNAQACPCGVPDSVCFF